ncbi:MAG: hypothetical protein ABIN89_31270 [Chitinophagaceae bacterium]
MNTAPLKTDINAVLVIGHPGHELRAYKFIKEYQPDVIILTDGSGSNNSSRISQTIAILNSLGSKYVKILAPYTDTEIYKFILERNFDEINRVKQIIRFEIEKNRYNLIVGDSLEGFNPTHDLCRYIINSIVKDIRLDNITAEILNYGFDLDSAPNKIPVTERGNIFSLKLDASDFESKLEAALNYPEIKLEVDKAIQYFGKEAFFTEFFIENSNLDVMENWSTPCPAYESYGRQRVSNGIYNEVIEFEKHMKPIAISLLHL